MEIQRLSTHQRNVVLRGIMGGTALKGRSPKIVNGHTAIVCEGTLSIWDICCISSDAEAFGLKASFGYDGKSVIRIDDGNENEDLNRQP